MNRKRQIKIIYFYVINTSPYKIIDGDSQTHIIKLAWSLGRRVVVACGAMKCKT